MGSETARLSVLIALIVAALLLGGGSRADIISLLLLRPLSLLVLGYAVIVRFGVGTRPGWPVWLVLAFAALHVAQLVPLPYDAWSALPGRALFARMDAQAELGRIPRPLTLSPATTINSLFALATPLAAILLFGTLAERSRTTVIRAILIGAALSCLVGLLQVSGAPGNRFYLYRVTNPESPVGLFANRNHHALFLACTIVLASLSIWIRRAHPRPAALVLVLEFGLIAVAMVLLILIGSRAGVLFGATAMLWVVAMLQFERRTPIAGPSRSAGGRPRRQERSKGVSLRTMSVWGVSAGRILSLAILVIAAVLVAITIYSTRDASFERFFKVHEGDADRGNAFPLVWQLVKDYFPWGSGYGTFEYVFKMIEPQAMLSPKYLNKAHDDWLQLIIEGGGAALLLLLVFVGCLVSAATRVLPSAWRDRSAVAPSLLIIITFFAASSAVDYPLRVPSLMLLFAITVEYVRSVTDARSSNGVMGRY